MTYCSQLCPSHFLCFLVCTMQSIPLLLFPLPPFSFFIFDLYHFSPSLAPLLVSLPLFLILKPFLPLALPLTLFIPFPSFFSRSFYLLLFLCPPHPLSVLYLIYPNLYLLSFSFSSFLSIPWFHCLPQILLSFSQSSLYLLPHFSTFYYSSCSLFPFVLSIAIPLCLFIC